MNMHSIYDENKATNPFEERVIIDLAGVASGMLMNNLILSSEGLKKFINPFNGLPVLIPWIPKMFDTYETFMVNKSEVQDLIFGPVDSSYVGCQISFYTDTFVRNFDLKKRFKAKLDYYIKDIFLTREIVNKFVKEFTSVGAFQTRNIPHLGHEKIIDKMLDHCNLVVVNPMIGPKKIGDINPAKLGGLYESILKPRYKNKIEFLPIKANMFYAGPREAIHHSRIRQWLGFTHFAVGRDHAGAEGLYADHAAINMIKKYAGDLSIEIIAHSGAIYCSQCQNVVLQDDCKHKKSRLREISGSDFRHSLKIGKTYPFASLDVQKWASRNFAYLET
ncbi:MAG: hypothetical protein ACJZ8I_01395 [Paracoccaceae bacterium]